MRRRRRLQAAIAAGLEILPERVKTDSPSRLARKLGVNRSERKRISLLQRSSSDKRTPYTRIADRVLGSDRVQLERLIEVDTEVEVEGAGIGPWMGQRFSILRGGVADVESNEDEQWIGYDSHGRPVWEDVLDHQRKRLGWLLREEESTTIAAPQLPPLEQVLISPGDWPPVLPRNEAFTFRNFHVCRQNERAAHAVNEILEQPAGQLNPLVLNGESGSGKTHLLWATGWAFARQEPEKVARILSCATLDDDFTLPGKWSERFVGTSVLLIDDIHLLYDRPETMHAVGKVVDWALNLGLQVVLTSELDGRNGGPKNRLSQVLRQAVRVKLEQPSRDSLIMMLRTRSGGRDLLLDDEMLITIVDRCGRGWGAAKAGLEELAIAVESGENLVDSDDVIRILTGRSPTREEISAPQPEDLEEFGEKLAREVLDTVFADPLNPAVDIHTVLPEIGSDDYTPPDLMPKSSLAAVESVVERHVGELMDRKNEYVTSALTLSERDAHLVASPPQLPFEEQVKIADDLVPLAINTDAAFQRLEDELDNQRENLADIEGELQAIALQIEGADSKNLIALVDKLRSVEEKLAEIDPEALPLPEFEEAKVRRQVFKRLATIEPAITESEPSERVDGKKRRKAVRRGSQPEVAVAEPESIKVNTVDGKKRRKPVRRTTQPEVGEPEPEAIEVEVSKKLKVARLSPQPLEDEEQVTSSPGLDSPEIATVIQEVSPHLEEVESQEPESQEISSQGEVIPPASLQDEMAKIASEIMTITEEVEDDAPRKSDVSTDFPSDIFPESVLLPEVDGAEKPQPVIQSPTTIPATTPESEKLSESVLMSTAQAPGILTPAPIIEVIQPTVTELRPTDILVPVE